MATRASATMLVSVLFAAACGVASAQSAVEPTPPAGAVVVREVQGGGAQIYACRSTPSGDYRWALNGPRAVLIDDNGSDFGTHSAGPTWTALDGSTIGADGLHPLAKIDRPNAVPALLLGVTSSTGNGILSGVRFVRRSDTEGGLPPATGCDAAHVDELVASHYSAVYTFYK